MLSFFFFGWQTLFINFSYFYTVFCAAKCKECCVIYALDFKWKCFFSGKGILCFCWQEVCYLKDEFVDWRALKTFGKLLTVFILHHSTVLLPNPSIFHDIFMSLLRHCCHSWCRMMCRGMKSRSHGNMMMTCRRKA